MGTPLRPNRYRDRWCGELRKGEVGQQVRVAGWVHRRRDHGGLVFIDLRDRSGILQLLFRPEHGEAHRLARQLRPEQVVTATGTLLARDPENVNPNLPTGEVELEVVEAALLSKARTPPFPVAEESEVDELTRLRYRPLDLRRPRMAANLLLRDRVVATIRENLRRLGFVEVETPILTRSTPEGARDFLVPSRLNPGSFYALPQSPQLFKQLLMVAGVERYFQIARCFRDEDLRADRQPEFTQLDLEMAFVEEDDVIAAVESAMAPVFAAAGLDLPNPPWPRLPYDEAMLRYGTDRPDLRFGMEIADVGELVAGCQFRVFTSVLAEGGVVRGLNAGPLPLSRSEQEGLNEVVKGYGAQAVAPIYVGNGGWDSNLAKFFSPEQVAAVNDRLGARPGDLLLFVADREEVAAAALGGLRLQLAQRAGRIPPDRHAILWVVDFPLLEYSAGERRYVSRHHPFTSPKLPPGEDDPFADPGRLRSRAYDLVLDGVEIGGGSIRIHDPILQRQVFEAIGIDPEQAQARFGFLLEALSLGAPPHGGIALGIDRIVALCAGAESIRDVIPFPKTASGQDPLTGAPAPVDPQQLRELGIRLLSS